MKGLRRDDMEGKDSSKVEKGRVERRRGGKMEKRGNILPGETMNLTNIKELKYLHLKPETSINQ